MVQKSILKTWANSFYPSVVGEMFYKLVVELLAYLLEFRTSIFLVDKNIFYEALYIIIVAIATYYVNNNSIAYYIGRFWLL